MPSRVSATASQSGTWTRFHEVDYPSTVLANDMLVLSFATNGAKNSTVTKPDSSWVEAFAYNHGTSKRHRIWIKLADGTEGTEGNESTTVTTSRGIKSASQILQLRDTFPSAAEGTGWSISARTESYGTTMDPAEVTAAWGSADNLFVSCFSGGDRSATVTAYPSGYSNGAQSTNEAMVATAVKSAVAASDDPAAATLSVSDLWTAVTLVVRGTAETPTFVEAAVSESSTFVTSHDLDVPAREAGDWLVAAWSSNGSPGATLTGMSGWTELPFSADPANSKRSRAWIRLVDDTYAGAASTETITTSTTVESATLCFRIRGAYPYNTEGVGWDFSSTGSEGFGTAVDPPSVSPTWGDALNLYVALGFAGDQAVTVSSGPAGYSNVTAGASDSGTSPQVMGATIVASGTSDDPGAFTISTNDLWEGCTVVFRPAGVFAGAIAGEATAEGYTPTIDPPTHLAQAEVGGAIGTGYVALPQQPQVASDLVVEWDLDGDGDYVSVPNPTDLGEALVDPTQVVRWWAMEDATDRTALTLADRVGGALLTRGDSAVLANQYDGTVELSNAAPNLLVPDGVDDYADLDYTPTFGPTTGKLTVVFQGRWDEADGTAAFVRLVSSETGLNHGLNFHTSAGGTSTPSLTVGGATTFATANGPGAGDPLTDGEYFTCAAVVDDGDIGVYRNGHGLATGTDITGVGAISHDSLRVFAPAYAAGETASSMRAVLVADDALTETQLDALHALLGPVDSGVENITARVRGGTLQVGRDSSSTVQGRSRAGQLRLTLDNSDGEFSFFNASSPLNTAPFSTRTGRSIRVRTAESTPTDPVLLTRDLFSGNGALAAPEVGSAWETPTGFGGFSANGGLAITDGPASTAGAEHLAVSDTGNTTGYCQTFVAIRDGNNRAGVAFYLTDEDNYGLVYLRDKQLVVAEVVAGTATELAAVAVENRSNVAVGVAFNGTTAIAYLDGVQQASVTTTLTATSRTGVYSNWLSQRPPTFTEFHSWDRSRIIQAWDTGVDQAGVLGTLRVTRCEPTVTRDGVHLAELFATGDLGLLDRPVTPTSSVGFDTEQSAGITAGEAVGNALAQAGALHPPGPIDAGTITLGSIGLDRQQAISAVRRFEETEGGLTYELPEGGIGFENRTARDGKSSRFEFSDSAAEAVVAFETHRQRDWQGDLVNEVTSEVSASPPNFSASSESNDSASANDVDVTLPGEADGAEVGDLCIVAISSTVQSANVLWLTPPGWRSLRNTLDEATAQRVYAKRLTGSDIAATGATAITEKFYEDTAAAGGQWLSTWFLVKNWFGSIESGLAISEHAGFGAPNSVDEAKIGTNDPPWLATPWTKGPTLFLTMRAGIGSTDGTIVSSASDDLAPDGFEDLASTWAVSAISEAHHLAHQHARRTRTEDIINPGPFGGSFIGFDHVETVTIAVRGFNGDPPVQTGGQRVVDRNSASQRDRGAVLQHPSPGTLFGSEDDASAYNDLVLTRYSDDRPLLDIGWTATKSRRHRDRAIAVALSDRVSVVATARSNLGVAADFYVEQIVHEFGRGTTEWRTTIGLSPVTDAGGGADGL